jgi:hypothetical protein
VEHGVLHTIEYILKPARKGNTAWHDGVLSLPRFIVSKKREKLLWVSRDGVQFIVDAI